MRNLLKNQRGVSLLEKTVATAAFCAVLLVASNYVKNAMDGNFKSNADRLGEQWNTANSTYTIAVTNNGKRKEAVDEKGVSTSTILDTETQKRTASEYTVNNDLTRTVTEQK